jgi:hypothetical protein
MPEMLLRCPWFSENGKSDYLELQAIPKVL